MESLESPLPVPTTSKELFNKELTRFCPKNPLAPVTNIRTESMIIF
jgi:hypothetical protein